MKETALKNQTRENKISQNISATRTKKLPFSFAKKHKVLIKSLGNKSTEAYYCGKISSYIIAEIRRFTGRPLTLNNISDSEFNDLLRVTYEENSQSTMQMAGDIDDNYDLLTAAEELPEQADLLDSDNDAPIIKFINAILTEALKNKASDIHIEPYENRLMVRFRVDGMLQEILKTRRALSSLVVSRIKVMSKLDIAEKRLPQDGRISLKIAGRSVDVRVSTIPSGFGERVVMRLLDKQAGRLKLSSLGMESSLSKNIDELIHRPHGIILVTGPTGSGKTTTLYAALERINNHTRNIMTVEDPIEYLIDGIGQTQVNQKIAMTFSKGLRAILRQDPDVVMIGEIRDLETAEIAIQASLTGHLVFATLHTNTAIGAVTRLRDMGVEPFLLSSSLIGVIAQRLVRTLKEDTKESYKANKYECEALKINPKTPPTLYKGKSNESGDFSGRTGIYELMTVDEKMKALIHDGASEHDMELHTRITHKSIRADGRRQVLLGKTTLEEVLRVTQED
ncbi:MAG: general secretion pathway protein E [Woeseiaceae bacterium]|jgi:general secretion pathway protein E|tara:strand:- start:8224 stop:9750 length:1527 start_codon:yes stop_codon:yes gene_type:complete